MLKPPSVNSDPRWGCDRTAGNRIAALVPTQDNRGWQRAPGGLKKSILWGLDPAAVLCPGSQGRVREVWEGRAWGQPGAGRPPGSDSLPSGCPRAGSTPGVQRGVRVCPSGWCWGARRGHRSHRPGKHRSHRTDPAGQGAGHVGSFRTPALGSHRATNPVFWEGGSSSKYLRRGRGEATQASGSSAERCPGRRQTSPGTGQSPRGARGSPGAASRRAGGWGRGRTRSSSRAQAAGEGVGGVYFQTGRCPGGSKPPGERGGGEGGRRGQAGRGREART